MKKLVMFFLLLGTSAFAQVKETRKVADFNKVKVSQSIKLDFTYGKTKSTVVEVEEKSDLQYVKTEVLADGLLKVYIDVPKGMKSLKIKNVRVYVSNPSLEGVGVSSSAKFHLLNSIKAKSFKVTTSSSGDYEGALVQTDNLTLEASSSSEIEGSFEVTNNTSLATSSSAEIEISLKGNKASIVSSSSSTVKVKGTANDVVAEASSSASVDASGFKVKTLDARASSSGSIDMNVSETVSGRASSAGQITYTGTAKLTSKKVSSAGQIKKG
ncbi:MAG: DUF2807 domain-containing protein [Flavobacteriaceae bacterium]|jgi:hypothetical protein|nr:DUF2807 domain-containing protein [Flavobacteriaceae bacterium]